jgi:hypothetical protein
MELYLITLRCVDTNEVEENKVFLFSREYKKMRKQINEVVYTDDEDKQWALISITK